MLLIRNVFRAKPGQARALVKMFKETIPKVQKVGGMNNARVMTDVAAGFWTVVFEMEAESLEAWERQFESMSSRPQLRKSMEGYMDLVDGGYREIFKIE
jgi:hypothetical protein